MFFCPFGRRPDKLRPILHQSAERADAMKEELKPGALSSGFVKYFSNQDGESGFAIK